MEILIGIMGLVLLIMFFTNNNMKKELGFYKQRLINIEYNRRAGFKTKLLVERELDRQFSSEER